MEEDGSLFTLPKLKLPKLDVDRDSEDDFMKSLVEAANNVHLHSRIAASLQPTVEIDPEEYKILAGHMVRLCKLYDTMLLLTVKKRTEMFFIIKRAFTETIINFKYLLDNINKDMCDKFHKGSLAYERKLYDEIVKRKQRNFLQVEDRIIQSIKRTFRRSGYKIEDVLWKDRHWAGSVFQRAERTNMIDLYEFSYRGASHFVHGTWHDLDFHHLTTENGNWYPNLEFSNPRPQMIDSTSLLMLEVIKDFIEKITHSPYNDALLENVARLSTWFVKIMVMHEEWLLENPSAKNPA